MAKNTSLNLNSAFAELGLQGTVDALMGEIRDLYRADGIPWVVGYSGGKDSTAVLQLVWLAIAGLPEAERKKPVHVISTDTLVENPVVATWVSRSLARMREAAEKQGLPIHPHRLTPGVADTYWVNLIGKGYPAPRHKFRWCTFRLKITPSNAFINRIARESGEAIVILGSRKAESSKRASALNRQELKRVRDRLSPNAHLPNSLVYTPVESWSNDDVWLFLMQLPNPWGFANKELLTMYQGASEDGECPLVVDTSTPSCGDSRFGCWVCTLVDKDRSMQAMIQNDVEKEWMLPLLKLRDELDLKDDRHLRDFRRMSGSLQLFKGRLVHGPYRQTVRADWLRKVLQAQEWLRANGPAHVREVELITIPELAEIRRIWVVDKHEIEDLLPAIYTEVTGRPYPGAPLEDHLAFGAAEMAILKEQCGTDTMHYELTRDLLDIERQHGSMMRRHGLLEALEVRVRRNFFSGEEDAVEYEKKRQVLGAGEGQSETAAPSEDSEPNDGLADAEESGA